MPQVLFCVAAVALLDNRHQRRANLEKANPTVNPLMAKRAREGRSAVAEPAAPRAVQTREVYMLDELGRFVAGATAQGVPVMEAMAPKKALALARGLVAGREIPPGTFLSAQEGEVLVVVYGGSEFYGYAAQDASVAREVPHEVGAVVEAFEQAAARMIEAGGLTRAAIEAFPKVAAAAMAAPSRYTAAPVGPLAFARAQFRVSGARLALDVEVVNATPWEASRVQVRLTHDARALPLVSVKARSGGYSRGVLTLPPVKARSRDRAVLLFEPRQAGVFVVEGELLLGLDGGGERRSKMRKARTSVPASRVVATVPKTLGDFQGLIEGKLRFAAPLELSEALGGLATVAGVGTLIEKDNLAKLLDWHGAGGQREVWYMGLAAGPERPILVQVTQGPKGQAEVVVAAAKRADVLGYTAHLRTRIDAGLETDSNADMTIAADERPEVPEAVVRAAIVARQISADLASGELDTEFKRPKPVTAPGISPVVGPRGGRSIGDELVPGLIEALERSIDADGRRKRG